MNADLLIVDGSICDTYASGICQFIILKTMVLVRLNWFGKAQGESAICDADDYLVGNLFSNIENQLDSGLDLLVFSYYNSLEKNLSETTRSAKILPIEGKKIGISSLLSLWDYFIRHDVYCLE